MGKQKDLSEFLALDKKIPWKERLHMIHEVFPSTERLNWSNVFSQDPAIMGRIIQDIIRSDKEEANSRPGKRSALDPHVTASKFRQLQNEDYSYEPFGVALKVLARGMSIRAIAAKVDMDKMTVHKLLHGKAQPTIAQIESIAKTFKKKPSYFLEYRISYITAMITHQLNESPETSVVVYDKLIGAKN